MNFYNFYNLLNEYGQNTIENLIKKFQDEVPGLSRDVIRSYIDRFDRIKNNLQDKDITKYNWNQLEGVVDGYRGKERIKVGRLDPTVTDANILYNQNGIRIYLGKDKKSCIRYGDGYTFCISARGDRNAYSLYRFVHKGIPYFIFNDNLPKTNNEHLIVLFVYKKESPAYVPGGVKEKRDYINSYSVTLADNQGEKSYESIASIIKDFPHVTPIKQFITDSRSDVDRSIDRGEKDKGYIEPDPLEFIEYHLLNEQKNKKSLYVQRNIWKILEKEDPDSYYRHNTIIQLLNNNPGIVDEFLSKKKKVVDLTISCICYKVVENHGKEKWKIIPSDNAMPDGDLRAAEYPNWLHDGTIWPLPTKDIDKNTIFYHVDNFLMSFENPKSVFKELKNYLKDYCESENIEEQYAGSIPSSAVLYGMDVKLKEIENILNNLSDGFSKDIDELNMLHNSNNKNFIKDYANNLVKIPYFVITFSSPKSYIDNIFNKNEFLKLNELDKEDIKRLNWIKSAPKDVLDKIYERISNYSTNDDSISVIRTIDEFMKK